MSEGASIALKLGKEAPDIFVSCFSLYLAMAHLPLDLQVKFSEKFCLVLRVTVTMVFLCIE